MLPVEVAFANVQQIVSVCRLLQVVDLLLFLYTTTQSASFVDPTLENDVGPTSFCSLWPRWRNVGPTMANLVYRWAIIGPTIHQPKANIGNMLASRWQNIIYRWAIVGPTIPQPKTNIGNMLAQRWQNIVHRWPIAGPSLGQQRQVKFIVRPTFEQLKPNINKRTKL